MNISHRLNGIFQADAINSNKRNEKKGIAGEAGEILSAFIEKKTGDKLTLKLSNLEYIDVSADKVKGEVGDEVYFEIIQNDKDGSKLKQVFPEQDAHKAVKNAEIKDLKELLVTSGFIPSDEELSVMKTQKEQNADTHSKAIQAISRIKKQIAGIINNTSTAAINELLASGLSLDKISLDILTAVTQEVEANPFIEEKDDLTDEKIGEILNSLAESSKNKTKTDTREIVKALSHEDMPVSSKNVSSIEALLSKLEKLGEFDDKAIISALKSKKPLTADNLYVAKFTSSNLKWNEMSEESFSELTTEINKAFEREGIEKTDDNYKTAKLFIENDIAVTKENFDKAEFVRDLQKNVSVESLIGKAAEYLKENRNPADIDLLSLFNNPTIAEETHNTAAVELKNEYESLMLEMQQIKKLDILSLSKYNSLVTLSELRKGTRSDELKRNAVMEAEINNEALTRAVKIKRQITEISIKLTYETSARLINKNISINAMPLENALEALKNEEEAIYAKNLRIMGASDNAENVSTMSSLYTEIQSFSFSQTQIYGGIMTGSTFFSIRAVSAKITITSSSSVNGQISQYDDLMEVINPKYGDSYKKAENQLSRVLEELGFEASEENIRAAGILSQNRMDITEENLLSVKLADYKISKIADSLHPAIAAKMIKDGLNPSEMHVDDVLKYIEQFNGEYGESIADKLAKYIIEMDKSNTVSEQNRAAIISVYRMLNIIMKNGGAAAGSALNAGKELTLGNLFEMSKTFSRTKGVNNIFDTNVNDEAGFSEYKIPENNILHNLQKACNNALIDRFVNAAEPSMFDKLLSGNYKNKDLMDVPVESLIKELEQLRKTVDSARNKSEIKAMLEKTEKLSDAPSNAIRFMEKNRIAVNLANIEALKSLLKKPEYISKTLNELAGYSDEIKAALHGSVIDTSLSGIKNGAAQDDIIDELNDTLEKIKSESENGEIIEKIDAVKRAIALNSAAIARFSIKNDKILSVPIKINNKVSEVNMYVISEGLESKNEVNMFMSLNTVFGSVSVYVKTVSESASVTFMAENEAANKALHGNSNKLLEFVEMSGFKVSDIKYLTGKSRDLFGETVNGYEENPAIRTYEASVSAAV